MTANAAQQLGVHLGQVVPLGFYTHAQTSERDFGTPALSPRLRIKARLVGIIVLNDDVVQDDIDQSLRLLTGDAGVHARSRLGVAGGRPACPLRPAAPSWQPGRRERGEAG